MQMPVGNTDPVARAVLALTGNELFHAGRELPEQTDWAAVFDECGRQTVTVHGWKQAKISGILPESVAHAWEEAAVGAAVHSLQVTWEHNDLDARMRQAGIPYVVLKGSASARYYPEPLDRQMGDVDFLVKREDMERAGRLLAEAGFQPWEEKHICHVVYRKGPAHLEMHFEPAGVPHGEAGELVRGWMADAMDCARTIPCEQGYLSVPSDFHHGLVLLLHTSHHLLGEGIGLRHLCDWAVFSASLSSDRFREVFEEKLKRIGLWKFACILTWTSARWLGSPLPEWAGRPEPRMADALIEDIFKGGNFGRKQEGKVYESYLISSRGKDGVGRISMPRQFLRSLNEMVCTHWPAAGRIPLLLPAGWLFFCGRYLLRMAAGKRPPVRTGSLIQNAVQRKNLYTQFRLFESEERISK